MTAADSETDFKPVKSAMRALEVISTISQAPTDGMTFAELERETNWPRSSTYYLVQTLARGGYLEFDENDRRYRIGLRLWEADQRYMRDRDLSRIASTYLSDAGARLNETIQLAILNGTDNVYIAKVDSEHHLKLVSQVGSRLPAHATGLGKALLSDLPHERLRELYRDFTFEPYTPQTLTSFEALEEELERVRQRGYAIDNGEYTLGVYCVGVPVRDQSGSVVAAMSSSVPEARADHALRERMATVLSEVADELSNALGYRGDEA